MATTNKNFCSMGKQILRQNPHRRTEHYPIYFLTPLHRKWMHSGNYAESRAAHDKWATEDWTNGVLLGAKRYEIWLEHSRRIALFIWRAKIPTEVEDV